MKFDFRGASVSGFDDVKPKKSPNWITYACLLTVVVGGAVGLAAFLGSFAVSPFEKVGFKWGIVGYFGCLLLPLLGFTLFQSAHLNNCQEFPETYDAYSGEKQLSWFRRVVVVGLIFALFSIWPIADHIGQGHSG